MDVLPTPLVVPPTTRQGTPLPIVVVQLSVRRAAIQANKSARLDNMQGVSLQKIADPGAVTDD